MQRFSLPLLTLLLSLSACNSPTRLQQKYLLFRARNPEQFANDCADAFPVVPRLLKSDTTIIHDTTTVPGPVQECPPDSTGNRIVLRCPPTVTIRTKSTIHDTAIVVDSARLKGAQLALGRYQDSTARKNAVIATLEAKNADLNRQSRTRLIWLIGCAAVAGVYGILQLKRLI